MLYRLGLDIGIGSIGWAIILTDLNGETIGIIKLGVRIFDSAEQQKTGASLALPRREARGLRRRLRRKAHRIDRLRYLFESQLNVKEVTTNYDIYELRNKALRERLTSEELEAVMLFFAKHRGFKSNRKAELKEGDVGKLLSATSANVEYRRAKGYATVGEMLFNDAKYFEYITTTAGENKKRYRTRNSSGNYDNSFLRSELNDEIKIIFDKQISFGVKYPCQFVERVVEIINSQRQFDEGPGAPSQYSGTFAVGNCVFEKNELRAPKASYTAEYKANLEKLNNIVIKSIGSQRNLTKIESEMLIADIKKCKILTYAQVRKKLNLNDTEYFNLISYSKKGKTVQEIEKAKLFDMSKSYEIRNALEINHQKDIELIDEIALLLSMNKSDNKILDACKNNEILARLSASEIDNLTSLSFNKFANLSIKALRNITGYLEQGQKYSEAVTSAGYDFRAHSGNTKHKLIELNAIRDDLKDITSPVVKRAISQTIKVVNAIIRKYGSPVAINVELAREMSKNASERDKLKKDNDARYENNQKIIERIKTEFHVTSPKGQDILKLKLYEEQGGKCAYLGKAIDVSRLFDPTYLQVDHVIPYSRSFNDSFNNKVLTLLEENQKKGNRLPFEYFGNTEKWTQFESFVIAQYSTNYKKRDILLKKKFDSDDENEWKERNLNDTKYISRFMLNLIKDNLEFADCNLGKKRVTAVNGIITSYMRKIWGLNKIREDGDKHHAVDAAVIAMTTDGMIQRLTKFNKYHELYREVDGKYINKETGEIVGMSEIAELIGIDKFPYPNFKEELDVMLMDNLKEREDYLIKELGYDSEQLEDLQPLFVSRMPNRKMKGAIHEETIRSAKKIDEGYVITKTPLEKLKLNSDNEIGGYYNKESDVLLYNAIKNRLLQNGGKGKNAFEEKLYKPKANGENGNEVKSVKICTVASTGFALDEKKGYANNRTGSMVRVDIFEKANKYYGVPIYVSDVYKGVLPNKAVTQRKKNKWLEMDESYNFKFSLFSNDLIYVGSKAEIKLTINDKLNKKTKQNKENQPKKQIANKVWYLYFKSFSSSTASITGINHDDSYAIPSMGINTLNKFQKCVVDVLGNVSFVSKEERLPIKLT